jgi:F-type H+-transporting ATPase subunit c
MVVAGRQSAVGSQSIDIARRREVTQTRRNGEDVMQRLVIALGALVGSLCVSGAAMAAEGGMLTTGDGRGWAILGVMLGMGLATFGGSLGQGRAAAAALEGIARNPGAAGKVMTPMIIGLALIESLVLYSWVISFLLLGKI